MCKGNQFRFWAMRGKGHLFYFIASLSFCFMAFTQHGISQKIPWNSTLRCWGYWAVPLLSRAWGIILSLECSLLNFSRTLDSFCVQSLIIKGGKESGRVRVGVLGTHPLPSHRTKEFIEAHKPIVMWLLSDPNRASFGGGGDIKMIVSFYFSISF